MRLNKESKGNKIRRKITDRIDELRMGYFFDQVHNNTSNDIWYEIDSSLWDKINETFLGNEIEKIRKPRKS